jgi:hypothetical protein
VLAVAKGILIAGRGYTDPQAFDELLDVARRHHLTVVATARALIDRATGIPLSKHFQGDTFGEWDILISALPHRQPADRCTGRPTPDPSTSS